MRNSVCVVPGRLRKFLLPILVSAVALAGCAKHHLTVAQPNPAGEYHTRTFHAYLWGAIETEKVATECPSNALDEVQVHSSFGHSLAAVATLGIWMPARVDWKCRKDETGVGTFE